jgi:MFS family permease
VVAALGLFLRGGALTTWGFMALVLGAFFLASAGASSAYLTVSEIFPLEWRALAIALFYAVGTGVGGLGAPALFGALIDTGSRSMLAAGYVFGAVLLALAALIAWRYAVDAERRSLEEVTAR